MKCPLFFISLFCIFACSTPETPKKVDLVKVPEKVNNHLAKEIKAYFVNYDTTASFVVTNDTLFSAKFMKTFYEERKYERFRSDMGVFSAQSDSLLVVLKNARWYGLIPKDYHTHKIDSLRKTLRDSNTTFDAAKIVQADLLLTDAFFTFCVHLNAGRLNPDSLRREWRVGNMEKQFELIPLLKDSLQKKSMKKIFAELEPDFQQYFYLKNWLRIWQTFYHAYNWDTLPDIKKDTAEFYEALQRRLINDKLYDSTASGNDSIKLAKAIRKYQIKWNLDEDGKIGQYTYNSLKYSVEDRIRQIEMNMEKWRWESRKEDKKYIWINVPSYNLRVAEADTLVLEERVITGAPKHPSPLLNSNVSQIILNPYWRVPYKIATEEILPILKYDTGYLRRKQFEVLLGERVIDHKKINWKKYNKTNFPYLFRQKEGEDNSLGLIKFMFPNKYDVYLHDTDARKLFRRHVRALSHGCIRLDSTMNLAAYLIRDDSVRVRVDSLQKFLANKEKRKINVRWPYIPIYIRYYTCEIREHSLQFYYDIYGRDEKMQYALYTDRLPRIMYVEKKRKGQ